jgi:hypothetical protein
MVEGHMRTERGKRDDRVFSNKVYINLNHRDSRI